MPEGKKKPYPGKPDIYFDDFRLTTSISVCEVKGNFADSFNCGYINTAGEFVFTNMGNCRKRRPYGTYNDPGDNPDMGTICATTAGDSGYVSLFNS